VWKSPCPLKLIKHAWISPRARKKKLREGFDYFFSLAEASTYHRYNIK
jgi:hypothetical protein